MSGDGIDPVPSDLEALFAAERAVPEVPLHVRTQLYDRLRSTLKLPGGGGTGGGVAGTGFTGATLGGLLAILFAGGGLGYVAVRAVARRPHESRDTSADHRGVRTLNETAASSAGIDLDTEGARGRIPRFRTTTAPGEIAPSGTAESTSAGASDGGATPTPPGWFGQRNVEPQRIAGQVIYKGRPVGGADVFLQGVLSAADPAFAVGAKTSTEGTFDFGKQAAWSYLVVARAEGRRPASAKVRTGDPAATPPPDKLILVLGDCDAGVRGSVVDESGHGVPDAHVRVAENMFNGPGVDTDAGGHYELCTLTGPLRLRVDADGYASVFAPAIASPARASVDVHLASEGLVSGTIVRKETGAPIGRAQVNLWPFDPPNPSAPQRKAPATRAPSSTIANEQGQFVVRGLAPGRYSINAWASDALAREAAFVEVRSGETKSGVVRRLETTSVVDARVISSGRPVPGAAIMLVTLDTEGDQSSHGAVTQADGSVTLHGVFHGDNQFRLKQYRVLAPGVLHVDEEHVGGVTVEVEPLPPAK